MTGQIIDPPVAELRQQLSRGSERLPDSPYRLSLCWFPSRPDFLEDLTSSYRLERGDAGEPPNLAEGRAEVIAEFWEEVSLLAEWLESNVVLPLEGWQTGDGAGKKMYDSLNRRAAAIQLWESYGLPLRLKHGHVFRIYPPGDVYGLAIVHAMPFAEFATALAEKSAFDSERDARRRRQLDWWQFAAVVAALLALIGFFT